MFEASQTRTLLAFGWAAFVVVGLLLMEVLNDVSYGVVVPTLGIVAVLACLGNDRLRSAVRWTSWTVDRRDLAAIALTYAAVVGLLTLAFRVFTPERTLWMFLCFAAASVVGVAGPVIYTVWVRHRSLATLGITLTGWRAVLAPALVFAGVQFSITLSGLRPARPVDWVPLLVMTLVVGVFESIFFRGFIQGRFEASFGVAPAVIGAAVLYSLYHVAYGMGPEEMAFLFGLGIVYAIAFRVGNNVLVLWPLLTPLGSFFAQLESGELVGALPWAAILGFADEFAVMATIIWLARRHERRQVDAAVVGLTHGGAETVLEPVQVIAARHSSNAQRGSGGRKVRVRIEGQIDIGRPVEEVFDFAADERNEPRYNPKIHQVEKVTEGPIGVGTGIRRRPRAWAGAFP